MSSWSAPSGATRARARSSTGCPSAPMSSCASRAATTPATRWSSAASTYKLCAAAVGRGAARQAVGHRQRRGGRSLGAARRDRRSSRRRASTITPDNLQHRRQRGADPAARTASSTGRARSGRRQARSARPAAASARPTRTRSAAARSALMRSRRAARRSDDKVDRLLRAPQRAAPRPRRSPRSTATRIARRAARDRAEDPALHADAGLAAARRARAARASASCSRARRARCSTSTTAPIPYVTSSNTVAGQAAAGSGHRARRRSAIVLGITKAYTTRVGERPVPDRAERRDRRALGERGREFGTVTGRPRRCGWFDAVLVRQAVQTSRHRRHRADQARRARRVRRDQGLRRLPARRRRASTTCPASQRAQARVEPVYETIEGWNETTARRALLGRSAGAGDQVRPPHRGADRRAGRAAVDQPRARRHHTRS